MTEPNLDEILQKLCDYVYNAGASAKHNGIFVGGEPKKEASQAILDWHNKQVEEIIGEDEKTDYPAPASWVGEDAAIRNKLRAEQRQRAKGGEIV